MSDNVLQPEIQFDAALHQYSVDNNLVPVHVTGILEQYGLIDYSGVPRFTLERKQLIGDLVHRITAYHDLDGLSIDLALGMVLDEEEEQCLTFEVSRDDVSPYCLAHLRFLKESGFTSIPGMIERRHVATVNGMRYGMTVDDAGYLNKLPTILDKKCTHGKEKSWGVQLAGYALGLPKPVQVVRWERANLWLKPDATYSILPGGRVATDRTKERRDEEVFMAALRLSWWKLEEVGHI